jgi:hypothetical protein
VNGDYPNNCIKGIKSADFVVGEKVGTHLFYFFDSPARQDGWMEQSINWEDDCGVMDFTLQQRKTDQTLQFKAGIAIIPRNEIDKIMLLPGSVDLLSYERQVLPDNPYHGNILLKEGTPNHVMVQIAGSLALAVSETRRNKFAL